MNASVTRIHVSVPYLIRTLALATGAVVILTWLQLVIIEWVRHGSPDFRSFHQAAQAATLVVVFAGYLVGWRNALVGGLLSIIGTAAFAAVCALTFDGSFRISWVLFAAPGVLYVIAWYADHRQGKLIL
jgi:hypothetical protein